MHRIVLRVTHGPRWCEKQRRHLQNGETIVLEAATAAELKTMIALHAAHCKTVVEGDIPDLTPPKPPRARRSLPPQDADQSAPAAGGPVTHPTPPKRHKHEDAPAENKPDGHACIRCGQQFKSAEGLERHYKHSRHNIEAAPEA